MQNYSYPYFIFLFSSTSSCTDSQDGVLNECCCPETRWQHFETKTAIRMLIERTWLHKQFLKMSDFCLFNDVSSSALDIGLLHWMVKWSCELWRECRTKCPLSVLKYHLSICREGLRKTPLKPSVSQDVQFSGRYSEPETCRREAYKTETAVIY